MADKNRKYSKIKTVEEAFHFIINLFTLNPHKIKGDVAIEIQELKREFLFRVQRIEFIILNTNKP